MLDSCMGGMLVSFQHQEDDGFPMWLLSQMGSCSGPRPAFPPESWVSFLMLTQGWDPNCVYLLPPSSAATKTKSRDFPGGPVVKTPASGMGSSLVRELRSHMLQFSSVARSYLTLCDPKAACQASLSINNSRRLLKLMPIKSVMPSNHLILCNPLLLPPSIFPSIRVFSNELLLPIRWLKYWCFSFSISLSNEYSGLISFTMDWLYLLAV